MHHQRSFYAASTQHHHRFPVSFFSFLGHTLLGLETMADAARRSNDVFPGQNKCITNPDSNPNELKQAVDDYIDGNCFDVNNDCAVIATYGWPINSWCVGNITDMSELFYWRVNFDESISDWDTSRVTDMTGMMRGAQSFSGNISMWNTSSVEDMGGMFRIVQLERNVEKIIRRRRRRRARRDHDHLFLYAYDCGMEWEGIPSKPHQ